MYFLGQCICVWGQYALIFILMLANIKRNVIFCFYARYTKLNAISRPTDFGFSSTDLVVQKNHFRKFRKYIFFKQYIFTHTILDKIFTKFIVSQQQIKIFIFSKTISTIVCIPEWKKMDRSMCLISPQEHLVSNLPPPTCCS